VFRKPFSTITNLQVGQKIKQFVRDWGGVSHFRINDCVRGLVGVRIVGAPPGLTVAIGLAAS